ncbi:hypothetical protein BaRGS_00028448 [Batillaria attramentaria]|uniref:Uncharacterized protein n=1 Tax=Batillaria attramentaria TaxID=370345 RepID=A0ABD0K0D0_9CAEN
MRLTAIFTILIFGLLPGCAYALDPELILKDASESMPSTFFPDHPDCYAAPCPKPLSKAWERHYADLMVIRQGRYPKEPVCRSCPLLEFQPEPTYSVMFARAKCQHERIPCKSLRAEILRFGSASTDDVCKCPHRRGYRPVPLPDNDCVEFYSNSGCRCVHKPCRKGFVLSPTTYQCIDESLAKNLDSQSSSKDFSPVIEHHFTDYNTGPKVTHTWMAYLWSLYRSYGLSFSLALCGVAVYAVRKLRASATKGKKNYNILVCISFTRGRASGKICEHVFKELQNALPLLKRLYGRLRLSRDPDRNCISVIVRPRLCKHHFSLLQFVQDLLSSASVKEDVDGAKIVALHGSPADVKKLKPEFAASYFKDHLADNAGEITLNFANADGEAAILRELARSTDELQQQFSEYELAVTSVTRGSIKIKFYLTNSSHTFDTLANEGGVQKCVDSLLSLPSFRELAARQDVKVEFVARGKVGVVSANVTSVHVVTIGLARRMRRYNPPQPLAGRHGCCTTVTVDCNSPETADALQMEWCNVDTLLQRIYPGCRLRREGSTRIVWGVPSVLAVPSFVDDILDVERVDAIGKRNKIVVKVIPPDEESRAGIIRATERNGRHQEEFSFLPYVTVTGVVWLVMAFVAYYSL